jgi:hypothetical protein
MIQEMIKRNVLVLLKHFDECCSHWYDHTHYQKLYEINPDTASEYESSIYDFTVYLFIDSKPKFNIKCHPYLKQFVLYECDNTFEKTIEYVQSQLDRKESMVPDFNFLDVFELPKS